MVTLLELGSIQGLNEFSGSASVTNHSAVEAVVRADFYLRGKPGIAASEILTIPPGDTLGFPDIAAELFEVSGEVGTLVLTSENDTLISATGREFALFRDEGESVTGTAGQLIPGMTSADLLQPGVTYHFLGLRQVQLDSGTERSHLAAFSPDGGDVTFTVRQFDGATGTAEGEIQRTVRADELIQINNILRVINSDLDGEVKRLEVTVDGPVHMLAFRVNKDGDPITIPAQPWG